MQQDMLVDTWPSSWRKLVLNFDQPWRKAVGAVGGIFWYTCRSKNGEKHKRLSVAEPQKWHDKKLHTVKGARGGITVPKMLLARTDDSDAYILNIAVGG